MRIRIFPLVIVCCLEEHNIDFFFFVGRFCLSTYMEFLGMFEKVQKVTVSFIMSVHPSTWNNLVPTGQIFVKFNIDVFF